MSGYAGAKNAPAPVLAGDETGIMPNLGAFRLARHPARPGPVALGPVRDANVAHDLQLPDRLGFPKQRSAAGVNSPNNVALTGTARAPMYGARLAAGVLRAGGEQT